MKKILLGNSLLDVSMIGLGAINFGTKTSEKDSFKLMDEYVLNGGNFIDTANNYAVWNGGDGGESERTIGKWMQKNNSRKDIVIATKIGALAKKVGGNSFLDTEGLSSKAIREAVEKSLNNLKVDYIDLLYLHIDDYSTPQEETLGTLNELIEEGVINNIGCSNFTTWRIESARNICLRNKYQFFCAVQQRYSYLTPTIDSDFFPQMPMNKELDDYIDYYNDLTLVAHSPLLKGQYNKIDIMKDEYKTYYNEMKLKLLKNIDEPNSWVLKFITEQFGGSVALLTTSKIEHLAGIMNSKFW